METDRDGWSQWSESEGGYVWREELIAEVLSRELGQTLFVSGSVSNQGRFYPQFDAVVLLSAPAQVLLDRIAARSSNDYGKSEEERAAILRDLAEAEPRLRATCTHEIDATQPVQAVVDRLARIGTARGHSGEGARVGQCSRMSPSDRGARHALSERLL